MSKTILITGASSGIGKVTAKYFAEKGWNVAATMRNPEKETELQKIENINIFKLDVSDADSIQNSYNEIMREFGAVDVLLNNAGYGLYGAFELLSETQIRKQFEVNVFGMMNVTKAYLPHFRERKSGVIINVSSVAGKIGAPLSSAYCSTKFAVEGFSESLTFEMNEFGVRVKIVEPGIVKTDFLSRSLVLPENSKNIKAYDAYVERYRQRRAGGIDTNASMPIVIAEKIYEAATDTSDRLRYPAGKDSEMAMEMKYKLGAKARKEINKQFFN